MNECQWWVRPSRWAGGPDAELRYTVCSEYISGQVHNHQSIVFFMKLERTSFDQSKLEGPNPIIKTFNLRSYAQGRSASLRTNRVVAAEEWTGSRPPTDLVQRPG